MASRFLVLSDIHSNFPALQAVLMDAKEYGPYDGLLNAGDTVGYGPNPNECIQAIREGGFVSVEGNHDRAAKDGDRSNLNPSAAAAVALNADLLTAESEEWLNGLRNAPFVDPNGRFALVHGSFDGYESGRPRYEDKYISDGKKARSAMEALCFSDDNDSTGWRHIKLGIFGHTHIPTNASVWIRYGTSPVEVKNLQFRLHQHNSINDGIPDLETRAVDIAVESEDPSWKPKVLFNPGSVGQPRHGSYAACYGIFEIGNDGKITLHYRNVKYDVAETQRRMRKIGLSEDLIDRLSRGE